MPRFRDLPIRRKLMLIVLAATTASLMMAASGIVLADSILFRGYLRRDLAALAQIIAENSTASLAFNDPESASQTLAALHVRSHVMTACIYRLDRTVLASYGRNRELCPPPEEQDELRFAGQGLIVSHPIALNDRRIGTLTMVYELGEVNERIAVYGTTVLGVLAAASLLAFILSAKLRDVIATPVSQLAQATTRVSETGDYGIRAEKLSGDELGLLVDRFNEMLAGIQSRDNALKKALADREAAFREVEKERERFHFMAESMPQKIFTANAQGNVDYFDRQWNEYTGLSLEQTQNWGWMEFVHPDDLEETTRLWRHSVETGEPYHVEHRLRRADGKYRWHLCRAQAMRDANREISMWIGSTTEIHEQKEKEEALRRANDDLQQFAYSASHDLQEPIRNVAVYSEIVARRYRDVLDVDGQQFLGFLREGGRRLAALIDDLLAYTRAGMMEVPETPVDASAVLQHTLADLAEAIRESAAQVTYDPLPEIYMGEAHLQQVFQNLIGNALKYRNETPVRIHISAGTRGAVWCFWVQDNGIGIDPKYKEKIFGVFKRLHHDRKYSGTGIGLAICQRVVERYGGRIWVESEPGKGATFFFTVPREAQPTRAISMESSAG